MDIELVHQPDRLRQLFIGHTTQADDLWIASAWGTTSCAVANALWDAREQIRALVVGLDFQQTEPAFLRRFGAFLRVGRVQPMVFHPKLYLFRQGSRFGCLIGSSNLTGGGFGPNLELNVHITGETSDAYFAATRELIESLHSAAKPLRDVELADYERAYERNRRHLERAAKFDFSPRTKQRVAADLAAEESARIAPQTIDVAWAQYAQLVLAQEGDRTRQIHLRETHAHYGYLGVIRVVQANFKRRRKLARMTEDERRQVAGLVDGFLYFGSMLGAGTFMNLVLAHPDRLDRALDAIPVSGPVHRQHFDSFIRNLPKNGMGVGTATRLLAMKRPDIFLCLDSQNSGPLARAVGLPQSTLKKLDGYWELITRIWACAWFSSPRPSTGIETEIWDARVALLDAFYYGRAT